MSPIFVDSQSSKTETSIDIALIIGIVVSGVLILVVVCLIVCLVIIRKNREAKELSAKLHLS